MSNHEQWITQYIPRMDGKTVLITGANSGLGLETSKLLAARGARLILGVRDQAKGQNAVAAICEAAPKAHTDLRSLDLADLAAIGRFAEEVRATYSRLDVLVNNAGVMAIPQRCTLDGFEMQFGTNHLGHFALTGLLLPLILRAPDARVVTVASGAHVLGRINFDDLQSQNSYSSWRAYGQSKLANLLFAYELQRKFAATGARASSMAVHPGYAATNLQSVGPAMTGSKPQQVLMRFANQVFAQPAVMGALPTIYAATAPEAREGEYYGPDGLLGQSGYPKKVSSNARSHDRTTAARLWQVSEELTGVTYRF